MLLGFIIVIRRVEYWLLSMKKILLDIFLNLLFYFLLMCRSLLLFTFCSKSELQDSLALFSLFLHPTTTTTATTTMFVYNDLALCTSECLGKGMQQLQCVCNITDREKKLNFINLFTRSKGLLCKGQEWATPPPHWLPKIACVWTILYKKIASIF